MAGKHEKAKKMS